MRGAALVGVSCVILSTSSCQQPSAIQMDRVAGQPPAHVASTADPRAGSLASSARGRVGWRSVGPRGPTDALSSRVRAGRQRVSVVLLTGTDGVRGQARIASQTPPPSQLDLRRPMVGLWCVASGDPVTERRCVRPASSAHLPPEAEGTQPARAEVDASARLVIGWRPGSPLVLETSGGQTPLVPRGSHP